MPLLGKKIFLLEKPLKNIQPNETIYTISHTQEQFRSKKEYEDRKSQYKKAQWTCQCTGHINLTHKEAFNSEKEQYQIVKEKFLPVFEKPVLEFVHHSTENLDTLVDKSWTRIQKVFYLGEHVQMRIKSKSKYIFGKIVKVDSDNYTEEKIDIDLTSSDKENADADKSSNKSPTKWVPPKVLPFKYDLKMDDEDKIINGIPASEISRIDRPPSKDLLRLFIRSFALRGGSNQSGPWAVFGNKVKQHSLINKLAEVFVSPMKQPIHDGSSKKSSKNSTPKNNPIKSLFKQTSKKDSSKSPSKKKSSEKESSQQKRKKEKSEDKAATKKSKTEKLSTPSKDGSKKNKVVDKKSLKQMTLLDMSKGTKANLAKKLSPKKNPVKQQAHPSPARQPPVVLKLVNSFKTNNKPVYYQFLSKCARELSAKQRAALPDSVKQKVLDKYEKIQEKIKIEKMTPEEKKEFYRKKRSELQLKLQREKRRKNQKFEDTQLDLEPLPKPTLIQTPDGLANESFGDAAFVLEFISSYSGLLTPKASCTISAEELMMALVEGEKGFSVLSQIFEILLQTLLQDQMAEEYSTIGMLLSEIPVTPHSSAELVRLCLRRHDDESDGESSEHSDDSEFQTEDHDVSEELIESLETTEITDLKPDEKLQILVALCKRIMNSYSLQDYREEKQTAMVEMWKMKIASLKEKNDLKKEAKKFSKKEEKKEEKKETPNKNQNRLISNFYGNEPDEDDGCLASIVKRRRAQSAIIIEQKKKEDEEKQAQRLRENEMNFAQKESERVQKEFQTISFISSQVMRHTPIGTDRNHNRYWVFNSNIPGLYVEKGWVTPDIGYTGRVGKFKDWESSSSEASSDDDCNDEDDEADRRKRNVRTKSKLIDKTFPKVGQNLWFRFDSDQIEPLLSSLNTLGTRESNLKSAIESKLNMSLIKREHSETSTETSPLESASDCKQNFRTELLDIELRLRNGGLGGVSDLTEWEKRLELADTIDELGQCMVCTQTCILHKFYKGLLSNTEEISISPPSSPSPDGKRKPDKSDAELRYVGIESWLQSVSKCATMSRLHVLLGILESCVRWEKSAENAKCKICRRKGEEEQLLLCDGCNQAFHLYCLRPSLYEVPDGDWFCPLCAPTTPRNQSRNRNYKKLNGAVSDKESSKEESEDGDSESESNGPEEIVHELECTVCGGDEGLVNCSTCVSAFHMDCHDPPLRHTPRSNWVCCQCRTGIRLKPKPIPRKTRAVRRKVYEEDLDFDSHSPPSKKRKVHSNKQTHSSNSSKQSASQRRSSGRANRLNYSEMHNGAEVSDDESLKPRVTGTRRGLRGQAEPVSPDIYSSSPPKCPSSNKNIETVLNRLIRNKHSWPFLEPVNSMEVPDYYDIIRNPVDLQTMRDRNVSEMYKSPQDFIEDMALLFENAYLYNQTDSEVGMNIEPFENFYKDLHSRYFANYFYRRNFRSSNPNEFDATTASTLTTNSMPTTISNQVIKSVDLPDATPDVVCASNSTTHSSSTQNLNPPSKTETDKSPTSVHTFNSMGDHASYTANIKQYNHTGTVNNLANGLPIKQNHVTESGDDMDLDDYVPQR